MTAASVSNYVPTITQINLVKDGMSIEMHLPKVGTTSPRVSNVDTVIRKVAFGLWQKST